MRLRIFALFGFAALAFGVAVAVSPRAASSVQHVAQSHIDIAELTKAAGALPEQAFPAH
jgi:hypothetical protein